MIQNINPEFGDPVRFDSVQEMEAAIRELDRLNPGEGYAIPADGLREGRDYVDVSRAASALGSIKTPKKAAAECYDELTGTTEESRAAAEGRKNEDLDKYQAARKATLDALNM